jgi:hypothetical protein
MAVFPAQNSNVHCLEEQVKAVFDPASTKCVATGKESNICGEKVGGRKVQIYREIISEIIRLRIYLMDSHIDGYLGILEENVYCSDHELTMPPQKRDYWKSRILKICAMAGLNSGVFAQHQVPHKPECQILCSESTEHCDSIDSNYQYTSISRVPPSSDIDKIMASFRLKKFDTTPFRIVPRRNRRNMNTLNDYIRSKIGRNLSNGNRKPGYIYVFQAENDQRFTKIGYTTSPVIDRLKNLSFECNRQLKTLFPTPPEIAMLVPNAFRVEELCHAELVDFQIYVSCTGCLSEHHEWFRVSPADAIAVVKKWSKWMNSTPYDPALGGLKEKEKRRISAMDDFMNELAEAAT